MPRGQKLSLIPIGTNFNVCDCGFKTRSDTAMKLHLKRTHEGTKVKVIDETNKNEYRVCPICREVFQNSSELREHVMKTRHAR